MKFLCSNCKAKYQIPDEKIAGRTLKMDCRRCNTPITIRGDQPPPDDFDAAPAAEPEPRRAAAAPAAAAPAAARPRAGASTSRPAGASPGGSSVGPHPAGAGLSPRASGRSALGADFRRNVGAGLSAAPEAPRVTPLDQWHVAINDVPVGPMKRDEIARKIGAGAVTADSLAWREGFDDWRPIREIPELAALLRRATVESERPPARGAALRPGAPRAPAPRPAAAPGARVPAAAAAPAARATGRSNVVPIGGRLGASAAPSYDLDDDGDEPSNDGEATTVASAADLGLADFGKPARDDGAIPSPAAKKKEEEKPAARPAASAPLKAAAPAAKPAAAAPAPAAKAPAPAPVPAAKPVAKPAPPPDDDEAGLPPMEIGAVATPAAAPAKRPSFAPPPPVEAAPPAPSPAFAAPAPAAAPVTAKPSTPPPRDDRRPGLGVPALMGIAAAMAAGAVLMYGLVQRFILSPPPPTTTVVATVATVAPSTTEVAHDPVGAGDTQHEAPVDVTPPPSEVTAPPVSDVVPPTSVATTSAGTHRPTTTTTATPPSTGSRPPTTRAPSGPDPFAQFADDGASPATIASVPTAHHDEAESARHSSAELTAEQISAVRRSGQRGLTQCWETALRQAGHVDGDVRYDIDITIGTSGRVTVVHARGPTVGSLQDCLERGVRRWVFPPSGSETQTTFPIVFSAQQ